jgi:uncharacterized protein (TIGR03437 family)
MFHRMICSLVVGIACLGLSSICFAQISLSNQTTGPDSSVPVSVTFSPQTGSVSSLQFDLQYDTSAISMTVTVGDAARDAGKSVYYTDLPPNTRRFLIVGPDQTPIPEGPLVNLFLNLNASASSATYPLMFSNASGADPYGNVAATTTMDGAITVQGTTGSRLQAEGVLNAGSLLSGPVAPGEIITLIGSGIGLASGPVLAGTSVTFDGTPAPLLYATANQINAIVPYEISGQAVTQMLVTGAGQVIAGFPLPVAPSAPAVFTQSSTGVGQGLILNEDLSANSPSNPAKPGSVVMIFATGAGQTNPSGVDGQIVGNTPPNPILPVSVQIGGAGCEVLYAGEASGLISGVLQVNCRLAGGVSSGYSVPVVLTVGATSSPEGVTLAIQ